jgi:hypothetical protein
VTYRKSHIFYALYARITQLTDNNDHQLTDYYEYGLDTPWKRKITPEKSVTSFDSWRGFLAVIYLTTWRDIGKAYHNCTSPPMLKPFGFSTRKCHFPTPNPKPVFRGNAAVSAKQLGECLIERRLSALLLVPLKIM